MKVATGVFDGGSVRCVWCGLPSKSVNSTGLCFHKFAPYCCLMNRPAPPNPPPPSPSLLIPLSLPSWVPVSVCGLMLRQQDDAGLGAVPAARSLPEQGRRYPAAKSALDGMTNHKRRILLYRHESFPSFFFFFVNTTFFLFPNSHKLPHQPSGIPKRSDVETNPVSAQITLSPVLSPSI